MAVRYSCCTPVSYTHLDVYKRQSQVFAQLTKRDGSFLVGREKDDNFSWQKLKGTTLLPGRKRCV